MLPSIYISHGSPALMLSNNETTKFLTELPKSFKTPKYVLVISAHWVTNNLKILYEENPFTIYDFYNFPKELYEFTYEAPSSLDRSNEIVKLLNENNIEIEKDDFRGGYDHGVWSPLKFMYPNKDTKILQLSIPINYTSYNLFKVGKILSKLREDTLFIGSGALTHNLRTADYYYEDGKVHTYAKEFRDWVVLNCESGNYERLLNFQNEAPSLLENHPTLEHFLPLFFVLGSSNNYIGEAFNSIFMYGNQAMDSIIFRD